VAHRTPILAGNWKMHKNHLEAIQVVQQLAYRLEDRDYEHAEIAVCPPFTALRSIQTLIQGDDLKLQLGAQDCHWEDQGAFTGEVSPPMLAELDVAYVVVGHSERRELFGEDDATVNAKARAVLTHGMRPIVCVGETLEQREAGEAEGVVRRQLDGSLAGITAEQMAEVVVAYEPVWAIGTGKTALPSDADEMCGAIRTRIAEQYGQAVADGLRIQYGGSVKPGNVKDLMGQEHVDGALVGGASLDPEDFAVLCSYHRL